MKEKKFNPLTQLVLSLYKKDVIDINDINKLFHELYGLDERLTISETPSQLLELQIPDILTEMPNDFDDWSAEIETQLRNDNLFQVLEASNGEVREFNLFLKCRRLNTGIKEFKKKLQELYTEYDERCEEQRQIMNGLDEQVRDKRYVVDQLVQTTQKYTALNNALVDGIQEKTGIDVALLELLKKIDEDNKTDS